MNILSKKLIILICLTGFLSGCTHIENKNMQTENGTITGYVWLVEPENHSIRIDEIDVFHGADAVAAIAADGICDRDCFPNGEIYYRNQDPSILALPLSKNVSVHGVDMDHGGAKDIHLSQLKTSDAIPYSFVIKGGEVVSIEEIFRP